MDEYIKKSDALKASKLVYIECLYLDDEQYEEAEVGDIRVVFARDIENIPAADVEEVKHGEWVNDRWEENPSWGTWYHTCSNCNTEVVETSFDFRCPTCGAKMDRKEQTK